jgi:hypothetical protein
VSEYDGPNRRRKRNFLSRALRQLGHDPPPDSRWHHIWRDFVPLAALLIAAYAVISVENKVDQATVNATVAKKVAASQRAGRAVATGIICGALRGVEDAGRLALTDRLPGTARFRRPSTPEERRIRKVYARAYNKVISERIIEEAGTTADRVVLANGTVDCDALRVAAGTAIRP